MYAGDINDVNFCRFLRWTETVVSLINVILDDIVSAHVESSCLRKCAIGWLWLFWKMQQM